MKHALLAILLVAAATGCLVPTNTESLIESAMIEQEADELGKRLMSFYMAPSPEAFVETQRSVEHFEVHLTGPNEPRAIMAATHVAHVSMKHGWPITGQGFTADMARGIVSGDTDTATYVFDDSTVDPLKLDVWWSNFFATGETRFLERILVYAGEVDPDLPFDPERLKTRLEALDQEQRPAFLVALTASWSFRANCIQHEAVRAFAQACLKDPAFSDKSAYLLNCVNATEP